MLAGDVTGPSAATGGGRLRQAAQRRVPKPIRAPSDQPPTAKSNGPPASGRPAVSVIREQLSQTGHRVYLVQTAVEDCMACVVTHETSPRATANNELRVGVRVGAGAGFKDDIRFGQSRQVWLESDSMSPKVRWC